MDIIITHHKRCDVVGITGRVDSFTAPKMAEALAELTDSNRFNIILDLSTAEYVSSAGLRVMIDTQKTCKQLNRGEVVLVSVPRRIYETLELAGFLALFKFFDNLTAAVGSF